MPTISVRISKEEKERLLGYGPLSNSVRDALAMYLDRKRSEEVLMRLEQLQRKNQITTGAADEVRLIKEDRSR